MLRNYLLVSFRNLKRHLTYSFVNIFGLTIGLACTMVIGMWVKQEFSYDRHFEKVDNIYRIGVNFFNIGNMARAPEILKERLTDYSTVERTTNLHRQGEVTFLIDDKEVLLDNVFKTDQDFFKLFSYEFLNGDRFSVLENPNGAVISDKVATNVFGTTDVLGKTLQIKDDSKIYSIEGVVSSDEITHIPAEIWLSKGNESIAANWTSASPLSYVLLKGDPQATLDIILDDIMRKEIHPKLAPNDPYEEFYQSGFYQFLPIPIKNIHLYSDYKFEIAPIGNAMTTKVFAGVAVLILFLASINFINISTARSTVRAKEVGIRKSLGTNRRQLVAQFILESILICVLAGALAMMVGELFLTGFERLTGLELLESLFTNSIDVLIVALTIIMIGFVAGVYPAFYITSYQPVKVLKGNIHVNEKGIVRNGLVLFQFVISISLLVVSLFVFNQLQFIQNKDLGFDQKNVLVVDNFRHVRDHQEVFRQELSQNPNVLAVSVNHRVPAQNGSFVWKLTKDGDEQDYWFQQFTGDADMFECLGFRLLKGRTFSNEIGTDTSSVILNETAVAELGYDDPIGKTLNGGFYTIIGVVSDFNYETLKNQITPLALGYSEEGGRNLAIKFSGNPQPVIDQVHAIWEQFGVEEIPSYYFLDENFGKLVEKERVLSKAVLIFTVLAMFISCLGLYGLSVFTAERKTKEIGIRRVLGASVFNIARLLSRNFAKPILLAFILSVPVAYFAVDEWLANYAYRVEIGPSWFLIGGTTALAIGIATISWQSIRSALKNPVVSLRTE